MKETLKRGLITVAVFVVLYLLLPLLIQSKSYDVYVESICLLTAVIGAGFYWIGSK